MVKKIAFALGLVLLFSLFQNCDGHRFSVPSTENASANTDDSKSFDDIGSSEITESTEGIESTENIGANNGSVPTEKSVEPSDIAFPSDFSPGALRVCASGCPYKLPSEALAAANSGDVIEIEKGSYMDCLIITKDQITVRGVNGYAHLHTKICSQKGGVVTIGQNTVLENLELSGFDSSDFSTASIRHDAKGFNLTIRNLFFHDSQNGILLSSANDHIAILDSRFERVGARRTDGEISVPIYAAGRSAQVLIRNTQILYARQEATEIKSRSKKLIIDCSVIANLDGPDSYSVNTQSGGELIIKNSVIEMSPLSANSTMILYGDSTGNAYQNNNIQMSGNIFINDKGSGRLFASSVQVSQNFSENILIGGSFTTESKLMPPGNEHLPSREGKLAPYPYLPSPGTCAPL